MTDSSLASYDSERRLHAQQMINMAKQMRHLIMPRSQLKAILVHGLMRLLGLVPALRSYFQELKIKPANRFKRGLFVAGKRCGGQLAQGLIRDHGKTIQLSDELLGDQLTLVGFAVDPQAALDDTTRERWLARGGQFLQIGLRGQRGFQHGLCRRHERCAGAPHGARAGGGCAPGPGDHARRASGADAANRGGVPGTAGLTRSHS